MLGEGNVSINECLHAHHITFPCLLPPLLLLLQVGVFSATLPPEALEITRKFMNKPVS